MEEKAMQDAKAGKMVGDTPKKETIQSILRMGGKMMAAGKQYYKYKRKAELLDELIFDIETILVNNGMDFAFKNKQLQQVYWKYKEELKK